MAEQAAEWYAIMATPQNVNETVQANGPRHEVWKQLVALLARLDRNDPETPPATNLLIGLFASNELAMPSDPRLVLERWQAARRTISGALS